MANIVLNAADNLTAINLHDIYTSIWDYAAYTVTNTQAIALLTATGIARSTAVDAAEGVSSVVLLETDEGGLAFGGESITMSASGAVTGGTVHTIVNVGNSGTALSYFYGLDLSASAIYRAMVTTSTADDARLFAQMFAGNDTFDLSSGADKANGMGGNDLMLGMGGNDTLLGSAGADTLTGGAGNDNLSGGTGVDRLTGGVGRDILAGGAGVDRFIFTATRDTGSSVTTADRITDFTHGTDKIDLHLIDASSLLDGNNAFAFIGTAAFNTGNGGQVRYAQFDNAGTANDYTLVYLDTDADTGAEAVIRLNGLVTLTAADFVL